MGIHEPDAAGNPKMAAFEKNIESSKIIYFRIIQFS
jgi:hypothetical protein